MRTLPPTLLAANPHKLRPQFLPILFEKTQTVSKNCPLCRSIIVKVVPHKEIWKEAKEMLSKEESEQREK